MFQPACDIERISIIDVLRTLKNCGGVYKISIINSPEKLVTDLLTKIDASSAATISGMTLKDLVTPSASSQSVDDTGLQVPLMYEHIE